MLWGTTNMPEGSAMSRKIAVKVTLNTNDPFDSEIIRALEGERNRAGFFRKAVFCYIRGLGTQQPAMPGPGPAKTEKERLINDKLARLTDL